jgi:hypothetical protein
MITRRRFLWLAGAGAIPVGAGLLVWRDTAGGLVGRSARRLDAMVRRPEARLQAHFDYLDLDAGGVRQFFADVARFNPAFSPRRPLGPDIHTQYLMSTDFFRHGADESRRIQYVAYYDPSVTACRNPLATFKNEEA